MKKVFIYYSLSGNGDYIADYLSNKNIDIIKIKTKEELPSNTVLRIMAGGFLAFLNHRDNLEEYNKNITNYDEVIIGTPIWNGRLSCPINRVIDDIDFKNKKIIFVLYSGRGEVKVATKKIKSLFPDAKIINIKEPLKNKDLVKEKLNEL